jgi:putative membrane protein
MNSDLKRLTLFWLVGLVLSGYAPYDRPTWFLEVLPALIALPILWYTRERFTFSSLAYGLILIHGLILMLGAAYTYSRVPMGNWVKEWFELSRNPYDKLGHFAQGFVPAIVARELLIRFFSQRRDWLLDFQVVCICLAISAVYELLEWATALALGQGADDFMGTQGDPFDTQSDMFLALIGALLAVWCLRGWHDRSMRRVEMGGAGR